MSPADIIANSPWRRARSTDAEFLAFNGAWIASVVPYLRDGGILGTFIDWRGLPTVDSAVVNLGLILESYRLGEDQRWHGEPLSLAA